ncbi:tetraacyldisaccharide 4'-kinase [Kingella potus]|uniref:tetraacyldisaccharide 4'-kinase n=1 Tax=Kingella potus TaxID=265175 RepID=UPI001FD4221E|nr:tetraacyldisaccharide 4'-kinase [Kingella potus]UOP01737.1 tetraacyldisaccharide 4'-kinase [Kingella potus]
MPKLHQLIERHWRSPSLPLTLLLWPLSRLFQTASSLRRRLYRTGRLKSEKLPVPVIVVGNIHAGGTGKTPIVAALAEGLRRYGLKVGIISRGYRKDGGIHVLNENSTAAEAGDEPLMLYRQTAVPTAVGSRRAEAARALLAAHPDLDAIISDDGLQHYALARDIEAAVFPAADLGRNPDLLPNGGLREPLSRLADVDFVIVSGGADTDAASAAAQLGLPPEKVCVSSLQSGTIYRLARPADTFDTGRLKNADTAALAGIARPERFFQSLRAIGIKPCHTVALPDHAALTAADLPEADAVFLTEKDAVKLTAAPVPENVWVLPVRAIIRPDLAAEIAGRLKKPSTKPKG